MGLDYVQIELLVMLYCKCSYRLLYNAANAKLGGGDTANEAADGSADGGEGGRAGRSARAVPAAGRPAAELQQPESHFFERCCTGVQQPPTVKKRTVRVL